MCIAKYLQNSDKSLHRSLKGWPRKRALLQLLKQCQVVYNLWGGGVSREREKTKRAEVISSTSTVATILSDLHIEFTTKSSSEEKP